MCTEQEEWVNFPNPTKVSSSSKDIAVLVVFSLFLSVVLLLDLHLIFLVIALDNPHATSFSPPHSNKPKRVIDQRQVALAGLLVLRKDHEMLLPNPSQAVGRVVLVLRKPQLAFLGNHVEDFALDVGEVRIATFLAGFVDVEFEQRGTYKQDSCGVCGGLARDVAG